jgi:hypothetical protein
METQPSRTSDLASSVGIRAVNDSIRDFAMRSATDDDRWDFVCECDDPACGALVTLSLQEYDACRAAAPPEPVLADHGRA